MEDSVDDDFGDLYTDVEVQASLAINSTKSEPQQENNGKKIVRNTKQNNVSSDCKGLVMKSGANAQTLKSKHKKACGSMSLGNAKVTECEIVANFSGGDWQDIGWKQIGGYGYGYPLPWNHCVDASNYLNFGFTNDSWRQYCISMEQLWRPHYVHDYELAKRNMAYNFRSHQAQPTIDEDVNQVGYSSDNEKEERHLGLPISKTIQGEDSTGEHQPTIDMKPHHVRDSDAVLKDSCNVSSGCCEKELSCPDNSRNETSKCRNSMVNDSRIFQSSPSTDEDNHSAESLPGNIRHTSSLERFSQPSLESGEMSLGCEIHENNQILNEDGYHFQKEVAQASEPLVKLKNEEEKVERNKSKSNQCLVETDITQGDQSQSREYLSFTSSDSEASEGSGFSFAKESYGHLQRSLSGSELQDLVSYEQSSPKGNSAIRKSVSTRSHSNDWHLAQVDNKDQNGRLSMVAERRIQYGNNNPISRMNSSRKSRWIEMQHEEYDSNRRDYVANHKDRVFSRDYDDDRFLDKHVQANYNRHPHRKYNQNFRDENFRGGTWNEDFCRRNYRFCKPNHMFHEREDRNNFKGETLYRDAIPQNYNGYKRYDFKDGTVSWRGKSDNVQSANITDFATCFPDERSDLVQDKYGQFVSSASMRKGLFDKRHEGPRSYTGRNINSFERRVRYTDDSPMDFDDAWGIKIEDEHQNLARRPRRESYAAEDERFPNRMALATNMCNARLSENYGTHGRQSFDDDYRFSGCGGSWNDPANVKNGTMYLDNECFLGRSRYRALGNGNKSVSRHGYDEFYTERTSYPCKRNARDGNEEPLVDHLLLEQHRYNLIRDDNATAVISKNHGMIRGDESEKIARRCGYPVDATLGNGNSSGRYFKGGGRSSNNKLGTMDMELGGKQTISKKFSGTLKGKATQLGNLKAEVKQPGQRRFDKAAVTESNLDIDIEEGQIVPEEHKKKDRSNPIPGPEIAMPTQKMRTFNRKIDSNGNETSRELDDRRILECLAKMERRRERFKDPTLPKNKPDNSLCARNDPTTGSVEQERPSRKRRWGGSESEGFGSFPLQELEYKRVKQSMLKM